MPLEKLPEYREINVRPVKLWLDDVQAIYQLMSLDAANEVVIEANNHRATDVDDLTNLGATRISDLRLSVDVSERTSLAFRINKYRQTIDIHRANNEAIGVAYKLADLLKPRRRLFARFLPRPVLLFIGPALTAAGVTMAYAAGAVALDGGDYWIPSIVAILLFLLGFLTFHADKSIVIAQRKADAPSFIQRNKDQLALNSISIVVGGACGYVLRLLTENGT